MTTNTNIQNPVNFVTGKAYQGDKAIILATAAAEKNFTSPQWATMKQWNSVNKSIAKGQNGTPITYTRRLESEDGPVEVTEVAFLFNYDQLARYNPDK